ncbi:MAG TPA: hypothetical protein PLA68_01755 [Panacibacter sp.]|nr:hypothetical protein [Panacibacter sp.]
MEGDCRFSTGYYVKNHIAKCEKSHFLYGYSTVSLFAMDILHILGYSDTYMPLAIICIFISLWKYIDNQDKPLLFYAIFSFILFGVSDVMGIFLKNNLAFCHIYSFAELALLSHYILKLILKKPFTLVYFIITGAFLVFWFCNIIFLEPLSSFNRNSAVLSNLIILFLCMYYLLSLSVSEEVLYFQKLPRFWIASGFLIYAALSLLDFISSDYINLWAGKSATNPIWLISSIAVVVKYVLIGAGLLCSKQHSSSSQTPLYSILL